VAVVRTDVSEERIAPFNRVTRIAELGTTLAACFGFQLLLTSVLVTMMMEAIRSSETQFLQQPHGVISQKMAFFIVTTVKTEKIT
jgi:hypothetical protein